MSATARPSDPLSGPYVKKTAFPGSPKSPPGAPGSTYVASGPGQPGGPPASRTAQTLSSHVDGIENVPTTLPSHGSPHSSGSLRLKEPATVEPTCVSDTVPVKPSSEVAIPPSPSPIEYVPGAVPCGRVNDNQEQRPQSSAENARHAPSSGCAPIAIMIVVPASEALTSPTGGPPSAAPN